MNPLPQTDRTFGLRVLPGATNLAARISLDFDQKLFRRNYRRPVLVAASLASDQADCRRWLAAGAARVFGHDLAARVLNRAAAEAAEPLFLQAVVHGPADTARDDLCCGLADACFDADCAFFDDPAGDRAAAELSVALAVTAVVERSRLMDLRRADPGDVVLAVAGDRLWPDTFAAARKALATFKPGQPLPGLDFAPDQALIQPAPLLSVHIQHVLRRYTVKHVVHAMTPIEADGLQPALDRLLGGKFELKPARTRKCFSPLLELIDECGSMPETADEAHRRGIAFLMVVSQPFAAAVAARLRRLGSPAWPLARLGPAAREPSYRPPTSETGLQSRAGGFNNDGRTGQFPASASDASEHRGKKRPPPGHSDPAS